MDEKKTNPLSEADVTAEESEEKVDRAAELRMKLRRLPVAAMRLFREYKRNARAHAKESIGGIALGVAAYLLGSCRLLFGASPLGLALLCASPKKILWILAGLAASAFTLPENAFIYIFAYVTAAAVRILARLLIDVPAGSGATTSGKGRAVELRRRSQAAFTESIYLRMATGAAGAFIIGIFNIIVSELEYYSLFGAVFSMLTVPIAVFVYAGCFEENRVDKRFRELAVGALIVSVTYALRDMYFVGISAGAFFAFFVTVYVCRSEGIIKGSLLGLLAGLAYSPAYAPMFAISGITVGVLWNVSAFGALVAGGAAAMLWGFYAEGIGAMGRILPAVMLSSICYMGARRLTVFPAAKDLIFSGRYCREMNDAVMARESRSATLDKLDMLSNTFGALSEIFYNLSDRLSRPAVPELRRMCDKVYDKYCPDCPSRGLCWELEYSASRDMLTAISKRLSEKGIADPRDIPEYMKSRCGALPGIIGEINSECAELYRNARLSDKTEVFAMEYKSVAALLSEICSENQKELALDEELSAKLGEALAEIGFGEGGVSVYGDRRKRIVARGFDVSRGSVGSAELKKRVEKACGFPVSDPIIELSENIMTLRMGSARRFSAKSVCLTSGAELDFCGDAVATFENCDDRYFALISDGMGSGEEASVTSAVCSVFLQKMLGAGNGEYASVKMLNSFIRAKRGECSSTVDLAGIDLLTGRVTFTKCGAAVSLVKRGSELFRMSAGTLPLGILDGIDAGKLSFDGEAGDVLIMMSDGVSSGEDDMGWLVEMLTDEWEDDLDAMAKKTVDRAREKGRNDDVSVIFTEIRAL